jgi:hypothetical protein
VGRRLPSRAAAGDAEDERPELPATVEGDTWLHGQVAWARRIDGQGGPSTRVKCAIASTQSARTASAVPPTGEGWAAGRDSSICLGSSGSGG